MSSWTVREASGSVGPEVRPKSPFPFDLNEDDDDDNEESEVREDELDEDQLSLWLSVGLFRLPRGDESLIMLTTSGSTSKCLLRQVTS